MMVAGLLLLVLPLVYAGVMGWLRGGWVQHLTPPAPRTPGGGGGGC
jgi:hypothetical protein